MYNDFLRRNIAAFRAGLSRTTFAFSRRASITSSFHGNANRKAQGEDNEGLVECKINPLTRRDIMFPIFQ
jgi:hypothetical protein